MKQNVVERLTERGIQPSAHRVAVAQYVLSTEEHPSAERVWESVRAKFPMISRATVYNTLNLFVAKGLLRELHLSPDAVVFDPNVDPHHHLIDEQTGSIHDIPWDRVKVADIANVDGYEIHDYQVVMRGTRKASDVTSDE